MVFAWAYLAAVVVMFNVIFFAAYFSPGESYSVMVYVNKIGEGTFEAFLNSFAISLLIVMGLGGLKGTKRPGWFRRRMGNRKPMFDPSLDYSSLPPEKAPPFDPKKIGAMMVS